MERKEFIRLTTGSGAFAMLGGLAWFIEGCNKMDMDSNMDMAGVISILNGNFDNPLRLFDILNGSSTINLIAQKNNVQIIKGKNSTVLGYGESILAPIIKINNGESVQVNFQNNLEEDTNIHWHGLIIHENMDGHPKNIVSQGSSFSYQFTINQRASTNWFHPHPHMTTGKQVHKGLAGMFIVNDSEELALNLPSGEFEIPLIIQDKRIYSDGSINYSPDSMDYMSGYFGDYVCVNGSWSTFLNVKTKIYRFRVLNGSNARAYNLAFSNGSSFTILGSDGGLLANSQAVNSLLLAPGERLDILVDFSNLPIGTEVFLQNNSFNGGDSQGAQSFNIMKFRINEQVSESFNIPVTLSNISPILETQSIKTRSFDISNAHMSATHGSSGGMDMSSMGSLHNIGGKSFEIDRIDETVSAGTTEIWEFDNSLGLDLHPMHLHGVQFQLLSRVGGRGIIEAHEKGWKDTVLCMPNEKVKIIMTFPNNLGVFVFHCHNLEHEDTGMMLNFQII